MEITIKLQVKPLSINSAYYKNRQYTNAARAYREDFLLQLQSDYNQKQLKSFTKLFNKSKHCIDTTYEFFYPKAKLFTKAGHISSRSCDLTNIEKLPQDFIFNTKYLEREIDGVLINNLNLDDVFITALHSFKRLSTDNKYYLFVTIKLLSLEESFDLR